MRETINRFLTSLFVSPYSYFPRFYNGEVSRQICILKLAQRKKDLTVDFSDRQFIWKMNDQDTMMAAQWESFQVAKTNLSGQNNSLLGLCKTENFFVFCTTKAMIANVEYFMAGIGEKLSRRSGYIFINNELGQLRR